MKFLRFQELLLIYQSYQRIDLKKLFLYINTTKYLKFTQLYNRLKILLNKPKVSSKNLINKKTLLNTEFWVNPAPKKSTYIYNEKNFVFNFLGEECNFKKINWNNPEKELLWNYNLHYFDYINTNLVNLDESVSKALIQDWIKKNIFNNSNDVGWQPYPTSLRIVNWIKWDIRSGLVDEDITQSISLQARYLYKNIEWHILGNHLFSNAKALVYAGIYIDNVESKIWLDRGLSLIDKEIDNQVLDDGGNFELSTMYHAIFYEDVLDLINILRISKIDHLNLLEKLKSCASKMNFWLLNMIHPDNEISIFNDAAHNIVATPKDLNKYHLSLDIKTISEKKSKSPINYIYFKDSGYIKIYSKNLTSFLDCAEAGADYIPSHAHADTLSFELSLFKKRLIINGGTSRYGKSNQRNYERSTASHSTVEINHENSSQVWNGFRLGNRAKPENLEINTLENAIEVACSHDGYASFFNNLIHRRKWIFKENSLEVIDKIDGDYDNALSRFIINPEWSIKVIHDDHFQFSTKEGLKVNLKCQYGFMKINKIKYTNNFGKLYDTSSIEIQIKDSINSAIFSW